MKPNQQDSEHLQILSIFHYVVGGIAGLFSLFPLMHVMMGIAIVSGAFDDPSNGNPPPAAFGWIFILMPGFFILIGLSLAVCIVIAGRKLSSKRSYTFCLVMAGIECVFMPLGTVLGVFTILLLLRPSVREMFGVDTLDSS